MKTLIFFLASFFFYSSISSQTKIEIKSLFKIGQPDENNHSMFACEGCYIILDNCQYDSCARIIDEFYPPEIVERKKEIPQGYEFFFFFDKEKKYGVMHIMKKKDICIANSWFDKTRLDVFYSPRY
jgi:hypothetical protein